MNKKFGCIKILTPGYRLAAYRQLRQNRIVRIVRLACYKANRSAYQGEVGKYCIFKVGLPYFEYMVNLAG